MENIYRFYNPVRINFGRGARENLLEYTNSKKCLIVSSKRGAQRLLNDPILKSLGDNKQNIWIDDVKENPTVNDIQRQCNSLKGEYFDAVIAFGGGSVIDSAKAISVSHNIIGASLSIRDLLKDSSKLNSVKPIPLYALPTTAGTGAEMTPFATFWDREDKKKYSIDHSSLFPFASFIDSDLAIGLPRRVTLSTGLDAINQACESIWNINATPYTLDIAFRALELGFRSLPLIMENENENENARSDLAECSMLAGIAISHTRTAMCHSISYPLTSRYDVPHGLACAFTMIEILKINLQANDDRFERLAKRLLGSQKTAKDLVSFFGNFLDRLDVLPIFKTYIDDIDKIKALIPEMFTKARAKNNLVKVNIADMDNILECSLNP